MSRTWTYRLAIMKAISRNLGIILCVAIAAAVGCEGPEGTGQAWTSGSPEPTTQEIKERDFQKAVANLRGGNVGERSLAAAELGRSGDGRAVEPLAAVIGYPDANVRHAVVLALSDLADSLGPQAVSPALEAIQSAASDPNEGVRNEAGQLLKKIRGR